MRISDWSSDVCSSDLFFLPLVGPTTLRDMGGDGIDLLVLPVSVGKPFNQPAYAVPTTVSNRLTDRVARVDRKCVVSGQGLHFSEDRSGRRLITENRRS